MKGTCESNVDLVRICLECKADRCTGTCAKFQELHRRIANGEGQYINTRKKRSPPKYYTYMGRTQSAARWAKEYGISRDTIYTRLGRGLSIEEALTLPLYRNGLMITYDEKTLSCREWSEITGVGSETLRSRIKSGWPVEKALFTPPKRRNKYDPE